MCIHFFTGIFFHSVDTTNSLILHLSFLGLFEVNVLYKNACARLFSYDPSLLSTMYIARHDQLVLSSLIN